MLLEFLLEFYWNFTLFLITCLHFHFLAVPFGRVPFGFFQRKPDVKMRAAPSNLARFLRPQDSRASKRGCFKQGGGGVSRSGLVLPFLSFLGLFPIFWDFPDLRGDPPGIFRFVLFRFLGLLRAPTRNSPERVRDKNLDLSRKKWETPGFGNPPV